MKKYLDSNRFELNKFTGYIKSKPILAASLFLLPLGAIFHLVSNFQPLERFFEYDRFWIDSGQIANLDALKKYGVNLNPTLYEFDKAFGYPRISSLQFYQNPYNPLTWTLLTELSSSNLIVIRSIFFTFILQIGSFLLIRMLTKNNTFSIASSISIVPLPIFWSNAWSASSINALQCTPLLIFLVFNYLNTGRVMNLVVLGFLGLISVNDVLSFIVLNLLLFSVLLSIFVCNRRLKVAYFIKLIVSWVLVQCSFWFPLVAFQMKKSRLEGIFGNKSTGSLDFFGYWKNIWRLTFDSFVLPREGSQVLAYTPVILLGVLMIGIIETKKFQCLRVIVFTVMFIIFLPSIFYLIPWASSQLPSTLRIHLNLVPILLSLAAYIVIFRFRISYKRFIFMLGLFVAAYLLFMSLLLEKMSPYLYVLGLISLFQVALLRLLTVKRFLLEFQKYGYLVVLCTIVASIVTFQGYELFKKDEGGWQYSKRNNYMIINYENRIEQYKEFADFFHNHIRVGIASRNSASGTPELHPMLIFDQELNSSKGYKTIFQYRENEDIVSRLIYERLSCGGCSLVDAYALKPPPMSAYLSNPNFRKFLGIKYIISTDEQVVSSELELIDTFHYSVPKEFNHRFTEKHQSGEINLYRFKDDVSIINFFPTNFENRDVSSNYYLEKIKNKDQDLVLEQSPSRMIPSYYYPVKQVDFGANSISIRTQFRDSGTLVFSFANLGMWEVLVDGKRYSVDNFLGLFPSVEIPAGTKEVLLRYNTSTENLGGLLSYLTLSTLVILAGLNYRSKRVALRKLSENPSV